MHRKIISLAFALLMLPMPALADIVLGSWNIQNLGWNNDKRFDQVAHVSAHYDFLAIQELMNEQALEQLEREIEAASGESWSSMASHALGRGSYQEHYAFLWRDNAVEYLDGAVVFIDSRDVFSREPYSARFRSLRSGQEFAAANVHVVYGDSVSDRLPEIAALADYWDWLGEVYPGTPRLLMGDFNLSPGHDGWEPLRLAGATPAITQGATTLSPVDGQYANLYDNVWKTPGKLDITDRGILDFPPLFDIDHRQARDVVSDHAPVYLILGNAELVLTPFQDARFDTEVEAANEPEYCIDLNTSSHDALQKLPHIGPSRAQAIIDGRPWEHPEQLVKVSGIGDSRVSDLLDSSLICVP